MYSTEDGGVFVLYVADDPVVAGAVPPETSESATKGFAKAPWIVSRGNIVVHVVEDAPSRLPVKAIELPLGRFRVIIALPAGNGTECIGCAASKASRPVERLGYR